jgi:hypothetical protein
MLTNSQKIVTKYFTWYSVTILTPHKGYRNLAKIARKYGNDDLWLKYYMLANSPEFRESKTVKLYKLNHTKLKGIPAKVFRDEFNWITNTI